MIESVPEVYPDGLLVRLACIARDESVHLEGPARVVVLREFVEGDAHSITATHPAREGPALLDRRGVVVRELDRAVVLHSRIRILGLR